MSTATVATIDSCERCAMYKTHDAHSRLSMVWSDSKDRTPRWLWCLGYYDQNRQTRRVVIAARDDEEVLVGEGLSVVGSAYRVPREPHPEEFGGCGECCEPEDFDWDPVRWENDGPVAVCHMHGALAPGWVYDGVEMGLMAYLNEPVLAEARR